jgi:hypothetical protein
MLTSRLRLTLASGLTLFLANCTPVPMEAPRPVAEGETELARTLCDIWAKSQATWTDADTPRTIDEIDYSYRVQEATCGPFKGDQ